MTKKINEILQLDSKSGPLPVVQALQHFHHGLTNPALGPKGAQSAMQAKIIQLGFNVCWTSSYSGVLLLTA